MTKFRKKPVVIEAVQWDGANTQAIVEWVGNDKLLWYTSDGDVEWLSIQTLEGRMRSYIWDWIIKGVKGEFYSCKPDIFAATYEVA